MTPDCQMLKHMTGLLDFWTSKTLSADVTQSKNPGWWKGLPNSRQTAAMMPCT